ncbi:MAG: MFS transporter [Verrucomicrobiota bacterium]|nr:MFS transporter [Verrucomicrobiota bacterium]
MSTIDNIADTHDPGITPNAKRLLWAGFMAILAAGVGFAIRGGIFDNWGAEFGFTGKELGDIGGAGFIGFCFGIIIGGVIADKIGYGKLVVAAFILHVLSAVITFAADPGMEKSTAYKTLYWGMFVFALANGTLEAVANPLVATLFPNNRTHYLNILHASWPAGMILGAAAGWTLDEGMKVSWKLQLALYLIPTVIYGFMFLGQHFPKSEASAKGVRFADMFKDVGLLGGLVVCFLIALFFGQLLAPFLTPANADAAAVEAAGRTATNIGYAIGGALLIMIGVLTRFSLGAFLLFALFVVHALVGAVELGTDQWIQNITGNILTPGQGKALFIWTSLVMFGLRFCAHFIEKNLGLSPVGILLVCSVLACIGLNLTSLATSFALAFLALTIYGIGKTFFWPTMLAVASDRFPRTGAIAISIMGGIGMMSAGLLGSPGLGYAKDRFAGEELQRTPAAHDEYKAPNPSKFLFFGASHGIDGAKLGEVQKTPADQRTPAQNAVMEASLKGDRRTLVADSFIPAAMALIYLLMLLYFKTIGGYKPVHITREQIAGGIEGPMEA